MSLYDTLLRRLDQAMAESAHDAMAAPSARDAFEYGRVSGRYAGLNEAKDILLALIGEEDDRDI